MAIRYEPDKLLKKIAPPAKIKRMITKDLTLKKTALNFANGIKEADNISVTIDKSALEDVALKTVRSYQQRVAKAQADAGFESSAGDEVTTAIVDSPALLINRIQNELVFQIHEKIKDSYGGQKAIWLPSSANDPRPEHQLNYGKEYIIGEGIDGVEPGDEYGCQCGVEIITNDTQLELD